MSGTSGSPGSSVCPSCGEEVTAQERFCENCGAEIAAVAPSEHAEDVAGPVGAAITGHEGTLLDDATAAATDRGHHPWVRVVDADLASAPVTCASCQGPIAQDGYCEQCGAPAPTLRDHFVEQPAAWVAAVCDRGLRHSRNEDAQAVAAAPEPGSWAALVVCDGVSSSTDSDRASLAAARAARDVLVAGIVAPTVDGTSTDTSTGAGAGTDTGAGPGAGTDTGAGISSGGSGSSATARAGELVHRIVQSGAAAQEQAAGAAAGIPEGQNPPSCTFVAAILERAPDAGHTVVVVGWVGDSRAYWIPDAGAARQLTQDDSWASEAVLQGMAREEAERMPQAHAITRWLGSDAPDPVPRTVVQALREPGWVLVCSDGLWNYSSPAQALADVLHGSGQTEPQAVAEALVAWANARGGHDNITVALARLD